MIGMAADHREASAHALLALRRLTLMRGLLEQEPVRALVALGEALRAGDAEAAGAAGAGLLHALTAARGLWSAPELEPAGDPLEAWLAQAVLAADTPYARARERGDDPGPLLAGLFRRDLALLHGAHRAAAPLVFPEGFAGEWRGTERGAAPPLADAYRGAVRALAQGDPWERRADEIDAFIRTAGAGPFNQAAAFVWSPERGIVPSRRLDALRLDQFIGYERQRAQVVENTERLLAGLAAHNLLLYGDRGTGKSATVKALARAYADRRLKVIELPKSDLHALPRLVADLAERGLYFILFVDDLSFEGDETEYKELKAFLEGSLQAPPANVRVYATSNRRHLVREYMADVDGVNGERRPRDTMEEKLSLADRFGVTLIFPAPEEQEYLEIVRGLARQRGVDLPPEVLERRALQWAQWQNGRSARTARQFVESLQGAPLSA